MTNDKRSPNDRNPKQPQFKNWRKFERLRPTHQRLGAQACSAAVHGSAHLEFVRFMDGPRAIFAMHCDHEPAPIPSQEGNGQKRVLPSWEGSGVGWFTERAV